MSNVLEIFNNQELFFMGVIILIFTFWLVYLILDNQRSKKINTEEDDESDESIDENIKGD
jgi:hypothetical protein